MTETTRNRKSLQETVVTDIELMKWSFMSYRKRNCSFIIAFLLFFSIISSAYAEPLLINEYSAPFIVKGHDNLLLINGTGIFLTTGDSWDFYQGYVFAVRSVNLEQKQVWVKLLHEDELLKEAILSEGDSFVYSKEEEILNITVDTIYASTSGELITFKSVYQYQDSDLPEPDFAEEENDYNDSDENVLPGDDISRQTNGFTIFQTFAGISLIMTCRRFLN